LNPSVANQQTIDILQVTKIGSSISIVLDYDLNSTSQLDSNESLAVLVVLNQEEPFNIEAAMLFFHTVKEQYFLFWMLGDPYTQAQNWQTGVENEHFFTDGELLNLNFIEYLGISDPQINTIVLALITSACKVKNQTNDFRPVLDQFITYLPVYYEIPSIDKPVTSEETSTEVTQEDTTESKGEKSSEETSQGSVDGISPGFTILSTVGIFLSTLIVLRFRRKK
jgi:hypothetical protein